MDPSLSQTQSKKVKHPYYFIIFDKKTNSLLSIYKKQEDADKMIDKLVRHQIELTIQKLKTQILDETDAEKAQLLTMALSQLQVQKRINENKLMAGFTFLDNLVFDYLTYCLHTEVEDIDDFNKRVFLPIKLN